MKRSTWALIGVFLVVVVGLAVLGSLTGPAKPAARPNTNDNPNLSGDLMSKVTIVDATCGADAARGSVSSSSSHPLSVYVDVQFLDGSSVVDDSKGHANVPPNGSALWDAPRTNEAHASTCRYAVSSAFATD